MFSNRANTLTKDKIGKGIVLERFKKSIVFIDTYMITLKASHYPNAIRNAIWIHRKSYNLACRSIELSNWNLKLSEAIKKQY